MSKKLLELGELREETVTIEGETLRIRECDGFTMMEYTQLARGVKADPKADPPIAEIPPDPKGALALLIHRCVIDDKGQPVYTMAEAIKLSASRGKVQIPLTAAVVSICLDDKKKESLPTPSDSDIDLPLPVES